MNHRLAKVLGTRLPTGRARRDVHPRAIVLHDNGMLDGNVSRALLEVIVNWIATITHRVPHEGVCLSDGRDWLVDEVPLRSLPPPCVLVSHLRGQGPELELLLSLTTLSQLTLGRPLIPLVGYHTLILRPKVCL